MLDLIASLAILAVNRLMHVMPMGFNLWIGRALSGIFYVMSGKRKMITYANIRAAFCSEKTPAEMRVMARGVYTQAAQTFAELISMTKADRKYVEKHITVRNLERIEAASKNPKGMILVSAHFGNWELSLVAAAAKGFPLYILARDQKMKRLNELFNKLRESKGSVVVRKGADIKRLIRVLREGKSVGLLADQNAGANGELLELFGRLASTAVGPYRLAQKGGAVILPAFIHRRNGPYHELFLEDVISIGEDEDIRPYMERYNRLLEKHVRMDPEQWFWMHKKWKMNPVRQILVLDDGKKGHFNQSMAVVNEIKAYRESEGKPACNIKVSSARISFRGDARKSVFKLLVPFLGRNCQGRLGLLKWALEEDSYRVVAQTFADIIISTGSSLAGVNMMLKSENYARNLTVLDPGKLMRKKFDVVVAPRHDAERALLRGRGTGGNVVVTDLAPNLIRAEEMMSQEKSFPAGPLNVGVLMGGDNRHFVFTRDLAEKVLTAAMGLCDRYDGRLRVTTSRRTPEKVEKAVMEKLSGYARCVKLVMGRTDTESGTVPGIMKESDVLIVSLESISMVSEAVSSGKRVVLFSPLKTSARKTKYEKFAEHLAGMGYLTVSGPEEIAEKTRLLLSRDWVSPGIEDSKRIREKLYRLF